MFNQTMLMSLIADIQTDIEYLKKVSHKLQDAIEELQELNKKAKHNMKDERNLKYLDRSKEYYEFKYGDMEEDQDNGQ